MQESTPIFLEFENQDERKAYGGTGFLELQYCRLSAEIPVDERCAVSKIRNWQDDSLYVHVEYSDWDRFKREYRRIFADPWNPEHQTGAFDLYGINYYEPEQIDGIIEQLQETKPADYELLVKWLEKARNFNGFYILGI